MLLLCGRKQHRKQQGIALIIVLWVVTLLAIMAGSFVYSVRTETTLATHAMERSQARALAEAGISYAMYKVMFNPDLENPWPIEGSVRQWGTDSGTVDISVIDSSGKIDLNRAPPDLLQGLLISVGIDETEAPAIVAKIIDWRDPDDLVQLDGAEEDEYLAEGYIVGPKNANFVSVEELQQVMGISPSLYQSIVDSVTVYSNQPGINPAAASAAVLQAIPNIDPQVVTDYIQLRTESIVQGLPLPPPPPEIGPYLAKGQGVAYYISAEAGLSGGTKTVVKTVVTQGSAAGRLYYFASWRQG